MSERDGERHIARMDGPVVLVTSPYAGHAVGAEMLAELLAAAGVRVGRHVEVTDLDVRRPQGKAWRAAGFRAAIAAGGDGTVGGVATQLTGSGLPLGILPAGTGNDVARSLGIPLALDAACAVIAEGTIAPIDAGRIEPAATKQGWGAFLAHLADAMRPTASYPLFLHAVTLGLNVDFARLATDVARRRRWGGLTYATSALEAVRTFQPVPVVLRLAPADAASREVTTVKCQVVQVVVLNTPVFGGKANLRVPGVDVQDRLLDVLVLEALEQGHLRATIEGLLAALGRLADDVRGHFRHAAPADAGDEAAGDEAAGDEAAGDEALGFALPGVRRFRARAIRIETPEPVDITADGEVCRRTPALVRVAPEPVHVFVPAAAPVAQLAEDEQFGATETKDTETKDTKTKDNA